jgi:hypothetical protein
VKCDLAWSASCAWTQSDAQAYGPAPFVPFPPSTASFCLRRAMRRSFRAADVAARLVSILS